MAENKTREDAPCRSCFVTSSYLFNEKPDGECSSGGNVADFVSVKKFTLKYGYMVVTYN